MSRGAVRLGDSRHELRSSVNDGAVVSGVIRFGEKHRLPGESGSYASSMTSHTNSWHGAASVQLTTRHHRPQCDSAGA